MAVAGGATERTVTGVPSRKPKTDYFEDRRATFSATKHIYYKHSMWVMKPVT
jgi:hypothetical protein